MRADLHLAHRAGTRGARGLAGAGDALGQHDRAAQVAPGEIRLVAVADIDQPSGHAIRRRTAREGVRDAGERLVVHIDPRLARQADIGVVHDELGAVAVLVELRLEVPQALQFVRRAGQLHPAGEFLHVAHQDRAIDRLAQRTARSDRSSSISFPRRSGKRAGRGGQWQGRLRSGAIRAREDVMVQCFCGMVHDLGRRGFLGALMAPR